MAFNAALTLLPKSEGEDTSRNFRPISLCNFIYKIISKVIANILKPKLSKLVSKEQFGFLSNRTILDVVGVAQECLHSIKIKNI